MGSFDEWSPAKRLLCQRPSGRHGGRFSRFVWNLFRHYRRTSLRLDELGRHVGAHRPRPPRSAFRRSSDSVMTIRVVLPAHLRTFAQVNGEVKLEVEGHPTLRSVLDALAAASPMLEGTIRDHTTQQRRPYVRFFACQLDLSHDPPDTPLPDAVATAAEPCLVI